MLSETWLQTPVRIKPVTFPVAGHLYLSSSKGLQSTRLVANHIPRWNDQLGVAFLSYGCFRATLSFFRFWQVAIYSLQTKPLFSITWIWLLNGSDNDNWKSSLFFYMKCIYYYQMRSEWVYFLFNFKWTRVMALQVDSSSHWRLQLESIFEHFWPVRFHRCDF